ncbi:MAG: hypothetical protein V2A78_10285, partial [bacterium]
MNMIESLEAYLAYKRYRTEFEERLNFQSPGGNGGSQAPFGARDWGPAALYIPGQGMANLPVYNDRGRWCSTPEGLVQEQRPSGEILLVFPNQDGTLTLRKETGEDFSIQDLPENTMIFTAPDGTQVTFIDTPDEHITERIGE